MNSRTVRILPHIANPLVPPIGDRSRIEGLEAQVEDLKYTLNNVLQCLVATMDVTRGERHAALSRTRAPRSRPGSPTTSADRSFALPNPFFALDGGGALPPL